jgi:predicted RNase H-like HicB family nuclease
MTKLFQIVIHQDEDGGYVGRMPELQGCVSQGDTLNELLSHLKEAIALCLEFESFEE